MSEEYDALVQRVTRATSMSEVDEILEMSPHSRESWAASIVWEALSPKLLVEAIKEAIAEIEHWHADMLEPEERNHPRGNGWARVYDKLNAVITRRPA